MRTPASFFASALAGALLLALPSTAPAVVVGTNIDVHQDIQNQLLWPNDFHVEGRICSHGGPPVLIDHVDGPFPLFNVAIQPDTVHGECWYIVKVDWSLPAGSAYIPYCTVIHLGVFFDVDSKNVIADLVGWWTRDGQPIPNGGRNAGRVPIAGFEVKDYFDEPRPALGQSIRLTNGDLDGQTEPGEIPMQVVQLELAPILPGQLEALLGPAPFHELREGGAQEKLPWVKAMNLQGPISTGNPQPMAPDSFFDIFLELAAPPPGANQLALVQPFSIAPNGFLVARQLVAFTNNAGQVEFRWFFEIHGATDLPACCLPGGACAQLPAGDCMMQGGTPQPAGSRCLGDKDGNGIDDLCDAKWLQLPDLSTTGMDVKATEPSVLADDFKCIQRSKITQIRVWGSWRQDEVPDPGAAIFTLSIHDDIPATPNTYSRPGAVLWTKQFDPTLFTWRPYQPNIQEGWYDPAQQFYIFPGDHVCFEYVFNIPAAEAFCQEGTATAPKVYWLDVQAVPLTTVAQFGWKTSAQHWNDDAVWGLGQEPYPGPWVEMRYPPNHPWVGRSVDLAFAISGDQPCEQLMDFGDAPEGVLAYPSSGVLGSFPTCVNAGPAGSIRHFTGKAWLGPSFDLETEGNAGLCPLFGPYNADECFADGDAGLLFPSAYTINAANVVVPCVTTAPLTALGQTCSKAVWGTDIDVNVHNHLALATYVNVLIDWDRDGKWGGNSTCPDGTIVPEHVLADFPVPSGYDGQLSTLIPPNFSIGPNAGTVWMRISITERPVMTAGLPWDGSGTFEDGETEDYLILVEPTIEACCLPDGSCVLTTAERCRDQGGTPKGTGSKCLGDTDGDGRDDLCEAKWIQLPDLETTGMDVNASLPSILADDFQCTQRSRITQIRIWGSWYKDQIQEPGNVVFTLSIHADVPATPNTYSRPGQPLWVKQFGPGMFSVKPYAQDINEGWFDPAQQFYLFPGDHVCWEYVFSIPATEAFCQEGSATAPKVYWLDVQAQPGTGAVAQFGWKSSSQHWNDDAVWGLGNEPYGGPWNELRYPTAHPLGGKSVDLAFTLAGDEPCERPLDFGDAPEGALAYPATGVAGAFPTCITVGPAGSWVQHMTNLVWLGPGFDTETDGNAGLCPLFGPYNADECFGDGDAGLIMPTAYTINAANKVVPCLATPAIIPLGLTCTKAAWGTNVDIHVNNNFLTTVYMNVLMDWDGNGAWGGAVTCPGGNAIPEHVLVNFPIPPGFGGPLSALGPPNFVIGPKSGHLWTRFTVSETPVPANWDGSGTFQDGETEDYLLYVQAQPPVLQPYVRSVKLHAGVAYAIPFIGMNPIVNPSGATNVLVECRNNGVTQAVIPFDVPVTAVDGTIDAGVEVIVSGGTIVSLDTVSVPNALVVNMTTTNINGSCVKITLHNIAAEPGGMPMADTTVATKVLRGDVTGDGQVLSGDISQVKAASGLPLNSTPNTFRRDFNLDGQVLSGDITVVKSLSGNTAPACP